MLQLLTGQALMAWTDHMNLEYIGSAKQLNSGLKGIAFYQV